MEFGAIAFGVGTSQVRDLLATQTMTLNELKVRRIEVNGRLADGVYAKDVILHIIRKLGVNGGTGFAYEFAGEVFDRFSMEERMTACNMSIEGGARVGYVNPDDKTFEYLRGRPYAPKDAQWDESVEKWKSFASDKGCSYDDLVVIQADEIAPTVTWGINPGQAVAIDERIPIPEECEVSDRASILEALEYMKLDSGNPIKGTPIGAPSSVHAPTADCRFGGGCSIIKGFKVIWGKGIVVPGSQVVSKLAVEKGLDKVFSAGFEWRYGVAPCVSR